MKIFYQTSSNNSIIKLFILYSYYYINVILFLYYYYITLMIYLYYILKIIEIDFVSIWNLPFILCHLWAEKDLLIKREFNKPSALEILNIFSHTKNLFLILEESSSGTPEDWKILSDESDGAILKSLNLCPAQAYSQQWSRKIYLLFKIFELDARLLFQLCKRHTLLIFTRIVIFYIVATVEINQGVGELILNTLDETWCPFKNKKILSYL